MKLRKREKLANLARDLEDTVLDLAESAELFAVYGYPDDLVAAVNAWNQAVTEMCRIGEYIQKHGVDAILATL